jgi:hypothetical protein
MTTIRRGLLVLALTVASFASTVGSPAQAAFADSMAVSTSIATATVAPPTNIVGKLTCGKSSATMSVTWNASTSSRVSGYLVTVYFADGFVQPVQMAATDTSWAAPINLGYVALYSVQYTVTTQTAYGWTTESARTAALKC